MKYTKIPGERAKEVAQEIHTDAEVHTCVHVEIS